MLHVVRSILKNEGEEASISGSANKVPIEYRSITPGIPHHMTCMTQLRLGEVRHLEYSAVNIKTRQIMTTNDDAEVMRVLDLSGMSG